MTFMQQEQDIVGITFGVISYLRCLFSDESFQDCKFNELNLKTLKNTTETRKMIEWIENINKHRDSIHKIVIGVYSIEETKEIKEQFNKDTPNIIKSQNANHLPLSYDMSNRTENKLDNCCKAKVNSFNEKLIEMYSFNTNSSLDFKEICRTLQSMKVLRGKYTIKLKVYTTLFVEINGFKRTDKLWEFNCLDAKEVKGFKIFSEEFANENIEEKENSSDIKLGTLISCCCTINTNENQMIQCTKCHKWMHASCHGYFSSKDRRIESRFVCYICLGIQSKELRDCSIYRRVLSVLYNEKITVGNGSNSNDCLGDKKLENQLSDKEAKMDEKPTAFGQNSTMNNGKFSKKVSNVDSNLDRNKLLEFLNFRLKISKTFGQNVITKLLSDGFLVSIKKNYEIVKTREIKEKIKYYFNGKKMECLISVCDIKCEIQEY